MRPIDLNDGLHNALLHALKAIELLVEDGPCLDGINGLEVIALPLNVQHHLKGTLGMTPLLRADRARADRRDVSFCPGAHVFRQGLTCTGQIVQHGIEIGDRRQPRVLSFPFLGVKRALLRTLLLRCPALKKALDHELQKAVPLGLYTRPI